jgi:hypothetical protein
MLYAEAVGTRPPWPASMHGPPRRLKELHGLVFCYPQGGAVHCAPPAPGTGAAFPPVRLGPSTAGVRLAFPAMDP